MNELSKQHWENIYSDRKTEDLSWYEPSPETSIKFINELAPSKNAAIIDVGGGDSFLVDSLLKQGYTNLTVLDISVNALARAKTRLGAKAKLVKWIVADVREFRPVVKYDIWHDRAAFHFLTEKQEADEYVALASKAIIATGKLVLGTFSENGPQKCSGLAVKQNSEKSLAESVSRFFKKLKCIVADHQTPSGALQNFIFCCYKKLEIG